MGMIDRLRSWFALDEERATIPPLLPATNDFWPFVNFGGLTYPMIGMQQTLVGDREEPDTSFAGLVGLAYKSNPVVAACIDVRIKLFSEARFQFRRLENGRPGELFGNSDLALLEEPWPGGTTGDLLARALQDADVAGNAYLVRRPGRIFRLRPDWVTLVLDRDIGEIGAEPLGYLYYPRGRYSGAEPVPIPRDEVAHFAPVPDPTASFLGMPLLLSAMREILSDSAATTHKLKFWENGATPNMVVSLDPAISKEAFDKWVEAFRAGHEGVANAYKTLFMGGGAKVEVVGRDFQQMDFKVVQGASETRIAAAFGVPPVIVGLSEGLQAATYSNYGQARRRFADGTMRPLWRNMAGSLARIIRVPAGAELWYDDRDIPFLQEDMKDRADIQAVQATAIRQLVDAGFDPASVVAAVEADDLARLSHTGLYSVQLQPPMPDGPPEPEPEPEPQPEAEDVPTRSELVDWLLRPQAPPQVVIEEGAVTLIQKKPMRSVIERDENGTIIGSREEPVDAD